MASPPHRSQTSYPTSNPKKRPSLPVNSQAPTSKRRKHPSISTASTPGTSHPLRQTSFPPEEAAIDDARSVSVETDATGVTGGRSIATTGAGAKGGKRGRRKKAEASLKSGARGPDGSVGGQGEEEEEDEGDADDGLEDDGEIVDKEADQKNLRSVVSAELHGAHYYLALQLTGSPANFVLSTVSSSMPSTKSRTTVTICFDVSS